METSFKLLLFLIILTFNDTNGRPARKEIKYGKSVYDQPLSFVSKK